MEIDIITIGEQEFYESQRVGLSGLLPYATGVTFHVMSGQVIGVTADAGQDFIFKDTGRDIPIRTKYDLIEGAGKYHGIVGFGAYNHIDIESKFSLFVNMHLKLGNIYQDVVGRRSSRHPADTLHIDQNLFDPLADRYVQFLYEIGADGTVGCETHSVLKVDHRSG